MLALGLMELEDATVTTSSSLAPSTRARAYWSAHKAESDGVTVALEKPGAGSRNLIDSELHKKNRREASRRMADSSRRCKEETDA